VLIAATPLTSVPEASTSRLPLAGMLALVAVDLWKRITGPNRIPSFTKQPADLHRLADWLRSGGVKTVAQSTGVYWIPIYEILEDRGFEVCLVNPRHTRNLPGRKSDVQESQWLLKLHTHGLLNNSFQPPSEIRVSAERTRAWSGDVRSTHAESVDADERAVG
jgi:Transposase